MPTGEAVNALAQDLDVEQVWAWLAEVPDPEIPVISVVDLGIVRDVRVENGVLVVAVTPTYSGCPATDVIANDIEQALRDHGVENLRLQTQLSPPWSTDWISPNGRERLKNYGIAPPSESGHEVRIDAATLFRSPEAVHCPRCDSSDTERVSEFGSTPCKAHYKCRDCLEPFDHFKRL